MHSVSRAIISLNGGEIMIPHIPVGCSKMIIMGAGAGRAYLIVWLAVVVVMARGMK